MDGYSETDFMRFVLAFMFGWFVVDCSRDVFGPVVLQPWWGIVLTFSFASATALFVWFNYRVFRKDS